jgi:ATP-dependent DNA ligase
VSKHRDRAYRAGTSPNWAKVKLIGSRTLIVAGYGPAAIRTLPGVVMRSLPPISAV